MNSLFYELIRVAIGTQDCLSRLPSQKEWKALYDMAMKQSLVGVCFAALQRLGADADEGFARIGISEMMYLTWMGMTAKIQQKNQTVDEQCVALQKRLSADGLRSSILKGQGVASLYSEHLLGLRQSGDIDIYVDCGMEKALAYAREMFGDVEYDYINAHVHCYEDTEVELHWRAQALTNVFANWRLQKWLKSSKVQSSILGGRVTLATGDELIVPSTEFNAFYILLHCYHHMFESGLGLRQLMDYYFVLREYSKIPQTGSIARVFEQFGFERFASAVMWIMKYVFGMEDKYLLCEPNEEEGRFILNEVMQNGNFGHHDERKIKVKSKMAQPFVTRIQHNWHLATHYPSEFFWAPVWLVYHFIWKRTR